VGIIDLLPHALLVAGYDLSLPLKNGVRDFVELWEASDMRNFQWTSETSGQGVFSECRNSSIQRLQGSPATIQMTFTPRIQLTGTAGTIRGQVESRELQFPNASATY
jgi:hypothetical protein